MSDKILSPENQISQEVLNSAYMTSCNDSSNFATSSYDGTFQNTLKMWKQGSYWPIGTDQSSNYPLTSKYDEDKSENDSTYEKTKNVGNNCIESDGAKENKDKFVLKKIDKAELEMVLKRTLTKKGVDNRTSNVYSLAKSIVPTETKGNINEDESVKEETKHDGIDKTANVLNMYKRDENSECAERDDSVVGTTTKNTEYDKPWSDDFQNLESSMHENKQKKRVDDYENPWGDDFRFVKIKEEAELVSQMMVCKKIRDLNQPFRQEESSSKDMNTKCSSKSFKLKKIKDQILDSSSGMIEKLKGPKNKTKVKTTKSASIRDQGSLSVKRCEHRHPSNEDLSGNLGPKDDGTLRLDSEEQHSNVQTITVTNTSVSDVENMCINEVFRMSEEEVKDLSLTSKEDQTEPTSKQYDDPWNDDFKEEAFSCEIVETSPECEEYEKIEFNESLVKNDINQDNSSKPLKQRRASRIERVKGQIAETSALMVDRLRSVRKSVSLPLTRLQGDGSCFAFARRRNKSDDYGRRKAESSQMKEKNYSSTEKSVRVNEDDNTSESENLKDAGNTPNENDDNKFGFAVYDDVN